MQLVFSRKPEDVQAPLQLQEKALLASLNISSWTARKFDKQISKDVAEQHGVDATLGRYNKLLIRKSAIDAIEEVIGKARKFHAEQTLDLGRTGIRLLCVSNFDHYTQGMREIRVEFDLKVREFLDNYPLLIEEARGTLNGMFNEKDYPDPDRLLTRFSFETLFDPLPSPGSFETMLSEEQKEVIRQDLSARFQEAQKQAMRDIWDRLYSAVSHLAKKMAEVKGDDGKPGRFHASTVTKLKDLAGLLTRVNLTNDPNLEAMRKEVEDKLAGLDPQSLRDDHELRLNTAKEANQILKTMEEFMPV